jgi:mRNA interferase RelE/StbE
VEAKPSRPNLQIYELEFHVSAWREWQKLDGSVKQVFKKQLAQRLKNPHVPASLLGGDLKNTYKIKLQNAGYRLVYEVIEKKMVVLVIAIGKRADFQVYLRAAARR